MHGCQAKEIERIGKLLEKGELNSLDLARSSGYGGLFAFRNAMRQKLIEIMTQAGNFGRGQVQAELDRRRQ